MRIGVIASSLVFAVPVSADPADRMEASGFVGVDYYGDEVGLGNSPAAEQRPQTAPTFGGRLTVVAAKLGGPIHLQIGGEAELSFTAAWTGYGFMEERPSYFAPVLGYKANLLFRLGGTVFQPHVTVGGGGESVVSESPHMAKDTDPVFQWGLGGSFDYNTRWLVRFDLRQGFMENSRGNVDQTYEAHMSIGARLGGGEKKPVLKPVIEVVQAPPEDPDKDSDKDGLPDKVDSCPQQAETVNGFDDQDGCAEADRDGDGFVDGIDKCPDRAEDLDKFQDEDGCAEDDNDNDGVPDLRDACPMEAETPNGIADEDGCGDEVPPEVIAAFSFAKGVKFEKDRARLSTASKAALDKALAVALSNPKLKITLTVHPESASERQAALAAKRLAVVKFYLTEQGVAMGNLTSVVGAPLVARKGAIVELSVTQDAVTTPPAASPAAPPAAPPATLPPAKP